MSSKILLEICADSIRSALSAEKGGADRIELCTALSEGGTTPSYGQIKFTVDNLSIPVNVLIRPRAGDFLYSDQEFQSMIYDIEFCKAAGASGIVAGILNNDGTIDAQRCSELIRLAKPMSFTFHRAFDMTGNLSEALETIVSIGTDRILTSGGSANVDEGLEMIAELNRLAAGRIKIMAGGGVNEKNAVSLIESGITEIHTSAREKFTGGMIYRNEKVSMHGGAGEEYDLMFTSEKRVRNFVKILSAF